MKTKKYWVLGAVVICFGMFWVVSVLGISKNEKKQLEKFGVSTLHDLKTIYPVALIVVQGGDKLVADQIGSLTRTEIQTQVELALRKAGIKVYYGDIAVQLFIYVEAHKIDFPTSKGSKPLYAFKVSTELHQQVILSRDPKIRTKVKTWPAHPFVVGRGIQFASSETVGQWIKQDVAKQMDVFCNDYLAANPKEPEKKRPSLDELLKKAKPKDEQKQ